MQVYWGESQNIIGYFDNYDLAYNAMEKIRQRYKNVYLCTKEREEAWETRPYFGRQREYDSEGLPIYDRQLWIENSLCDLERILESFELVEYEIIEDEDELKLDCYYRIIDDEKEEQQFRLYREKMKIQLEKKRRYEKTREGKPTGISAI